MNNEGQHAVGRILLTVPDFDSTASPWREAVGLATYLPKDRYELTVCGLRPQGFEAAEALFRDLGVTAILSRFRPRGRGPNRWLGSFMDGKNLRDRGPFDLQHSMDFTPSPFEALMSRRHTRAFVFSQRNMNEDGSRWLLRLKCRLTPAIICVSDAARRLVQDFGTPAKSVTVYPGIETENNSWRPFNPAVDGPFRILMVGHVVPRKRFEDGILAIAALVKEFPKLQLRIAGREIDRGYRGRLDRLIRESGVAGQVKFLGAQTDVLNVMRESDLFLHAAESEAFGMVLIEAMAAGLPVIAPNLQGPAEIIEQRRSGLLVKPGDAQDYAAAIRLLLQHPELGRQLSAAARKRVETHFSARRMAAQIVDVYDSLLPRSEISVRPSVPVSQCPGVLLL